MIWYKIYKNHMAYEDVMCLRDITLKCNGVEQHFDSMRQVFKVYAKLMKKWSSGYVDVLSGDGRLFVLSDFRHAFNVYSHTWERHAHRDGPVPHVHNQRASLRSCYRRIRTTSERRQWGEVEDSNRWLNENYSVKVKARRARSIRSLPNSWDDLAAAKSQRSWKSQRKTQWK